MRESVVGARARWQVLEWHDCYRQRHAGLLTKQATRHPAKMARALTARILQYGQARGWWRPGDLLVDCFAGAGTTLLVGALAGYRVVGVELEQKYVDGFCGFDCDGSVAAHTETVGGWRWRGWIDGLESEIQFSADTIFDSLQDALDDYVACFVEHQADLPDGALKDEYAGRWNVELESFARAKYVCDRPARCGDKYAHPPHHVTGSLELHARGLAATGKPMPLMLQGNALHLRSVLADRAADIAAVITSPAYAESITYQRAGAGGEGVNLLREGRTPAEIKAMRLAKDPRVLATRRNNGYSRDGANIGNLPAGSLSQVVGIITSPAYAETRIGDKSGAGNVGVRQNYGTSAGQLGALPEGSLENVKGVVASPPFEKSLAATQGKHGQGTYGADAPARVKDDYEDYGRTDGQLGVLAGDTYWGAVALVYQQVHTVLAPNGIFAVVVKDYIRKRQRVELCRQTIELLEALGFEIVAEAHAMMVKQERVRDLFGERTRTRTHKSFFRKLAEAQGAPAIDYEVILFARKKSVDEQERSESHV